MKTVGFTDEERELMANIRGWCDLYDTYDKTISVLDEKKDEKHIAEYEELQLKLLYKIRELEESLNKSLFSPQLEILVDENSKSK